MKNVGIIILAAGSSTRMGRPKQLLPINGQPLLLHVVDEALSASVQDVVVVLGSNADTHMELLETYPVHIAINENWQNGMGSSIKVGLNTLTSKVSSLDGAIFMTGDQPAIKFGYLTQMIQTFQQSAATVASAYEGTLGVPVLFPKERFPGIMKINDEHGAKSILQIDENILMLDCPEAAMDLDTPEDYESFRRQIHA